jgi:membrane fusion protein, multidrug efflux system
VNRYFFVGIWVGCAVLSLMGCQRGGPPLAPPETPIIPVSHPLKDQVTDYVEYTGRINPVQAVTVVPRVTGYLVSMPFKEGAYVKEDQLLFEIDARPYQAQLEAAQAQVALNEASVKYAKATNERFKALAKKQSGAVAERELDQYQALEEQAIANLKLANANLTSAQLNLDWTKVTSRVDGQISRYFVTEGNLVLQDQTQLTTVVSQDPMHAYFDMDESTLLRIKNGINDGTIQVKSGHVPVDMGLVSEEGYPRQGRLNFVDNQINPATGSISVRGEFANPKPLVGKQPPAVAATSVAAMLATPLGPGPLMAPPAPLFPEKIGTQVLVSGMFVRIRLPIGQPHPALLVIDRAITSDQGNKYVYVLGKDNKVESKKVQTGALRDDGLRVIEKGLDANDWVVIGALQQVRLRMVIQPDQVTMPSNTTPATKTGPSQAGGKGAGKKAKS